MGGRLMDRQNSFRLNMLFIGLAFVIGFAPMRSASGVEIEISIDKSACDAYGAATGPAYRDCVEAVRKNQPVFIFIPGILGSVLKAPDGSLLWGSSSARVSELDFERNPTPLTASILGSFDVGDGIYRQDVYGALISLIRSKDLGKVENFFYFPYDWRQDNKDSAAAFNRWLRSDEMLPHLKGRKIVIIAHSMGGLIYRYWWKNYFGGSAKTYAFTEIQESIFVAVPHYGAPLALYRLVEAELFEGLEALSLRLFGSVPGTMNKVGYTFPSLYQLLPAYSLCSIRIQGAANCTEGNVDVFNIRAWRDLQFMRKVAALTDRDAENLYAYVEPMLENALSFRRDLEGCNNIKNATFFFSTEKRTRDGAYIHVEPKYDTGFDILALFSSGETDKLGEYNVEFEWQEREGKGDGTVPHAIAECSKTIHGKSRRSVKGDYDHVSVTSSDELLRHIFKIRETATALANEAISEGASKLNFDDLIKGMSSQRILLQEPLEGANVGAGTREAIASVNRAVLDNIRAEGNQVIFARAADGSLRDRLSVNHLIAKYADDALQKFVAAQSLALSKFRQGEEEERALGPNSSEALASFLAGSRYGEIAIQNAQNQQQVNAALNTTGIMKFRIGETDSAIDFLSSARDGGHPLAERNLNILRDWNRGT